MGAGSSFPPWAWALPSSLVGLARPNHARAIESPRAMSARLGGESACLFNTSLFLVRNPTGLRKTQAECYRGLSDNEMSTPLSGPHRTISQNAGPGLGGTGADWTGPLLGSPPSPAWGPSKESRKARNSPRPPPAPDPIASGAGEQEAKQLMCSTELVLDPIQGGPKTPGFHNRIWQTHASLSYFTS